MFSLLSAYVQEIGRAGRDGKTAKASLYYNASDLGNNKKHLTDNMRLFCKLDTCRRAFVMDYFGGQYMTVVSPIHNCCDNCVNLCDCDDCIIVATSVEEHVLPTPRIEGKPTKETRKEAEDLLMQYFDAENSCVGGGQLLCEAVTGLCQSLAKHLSSDLIKYSRQQDTCQ